jgi:hypothetical protein
VILRTTKFYGFRKWRWSGIWNRSSDPQWNRCIDVPWILLLKIFDSRFLGFFKNFIPSVTLLTTKLNILQPSMHFNHLVTQKPKNFRVKKPPIQINCLQVCFSTTFFWFAFVDDLWRRRTDENLWKRNRTSGAASAWFTWTTLAFLQFVRKQSFSQTLDNWKSTI